MRKLYKEEGIFFTKVGNCYFSPTEDGTWKLDWEKTALMVFRGFYNILLLRCMFRIYIESDAYGVNSSVMLCLTSINVFFIAIIFYFMYGE